MSPVMAQVNEEAMAAPFDLLFGRKTYESFAAHWPNVSNDPHADKLNNATKYVATSTLSKLEWKNSTPITGDIAAEVSRLKEQGGPLLQVHGSSQQLTARPTGGRYFGWLHTRRLGRQLLGRGDGAGK